MPNAANTAAVVAALQAAAPDGVEVVDRHRDFGVIAVQGPRSAQVLDDARTAVRPGLHVVGATPSIAAAPVRVCRTGYTGEHGYELLPTWDGARPLWDALLAAVQSHGRPRRRSRRPGHPAHRDGLPVARPGPFARRSARCRPGPAGRWVGRKTSFFGRDALLAEKSAGPVRSLRGLVAVDRGVLRPHQKVLGPDGNPVGETTSGTFSPTLGKGIALALIDTAAGVKDGDRLAVDVRGRALPVGVAEPPFVRRTCVTTPK